MLSNRPIAVLRARVMGRSRPSAPARRHGPSTTWSLSVSTGPVEVRTFEAGRVISVGTRPVLVLTPLDVDEAAGETLDGAAEATVARMQGGARRGRRSAHAEAARFGPLCSRCWGSAIAAILLMAIIRGHHRIARRLIAAAERQVSRVGAGPLEVLRASRLFEFWRTFISICRPSHSACSSSTPRSPSRCDGFRTPARGASRCGSSCWRGYRGSRSTWCTRCRRSSRVLLIFLIARFFIRLMRLFFQGGRAGHRRGPVAAPGHGATHAPPDRNASLDFRCRDGLSLPAGERDRRVQGRERVHRSGRVARIERARQPDDEQLHDHLLALAAARRLRPHRRDRRHGEPRRRAVDQGQDASAARKSPSPTPSSSARRPPTTHGLPISMASSRRRA